MSETVPTSEALMTDPTTEEGQAYWAERNRLEQWAEDNWCAYCGDYSCEC